MKHDEPPLRLAVTGYVSEQAGSVASANALFLRALLEQGCEITFFSKPSFVDPRPAVGGHPAFRFIATDNRFTDRLRVRLSRIPGIGFLGVLLDTHCYHRLLISSLRREHRRTPFHAVLWLGEYARGAVPGVPTISFAQGPPGTDARSIRQRFAEIAALAGSSMARKWRLLARLRLSRIGWPPFRFSDRIIVGSSWSKGVLERTYGVPGKTISTLPYPVDLKLFTPHPKPPSAFFRILWLGRIIPRKRLDLFLDGAACAIRNGLDLRLTIVGSVGFIAGYEALIHAFPYPERLEWLPHVERAEVPALMGRHDALVQPSDEENFGSSVAEAQACGLPVIVGRTNGNADYLCRNDLHLSDDHPETLARALAEIAARPAAPEESRRCAEKHFSLEGITQQLMEIIDATRRSV